MQFSTEAKRREGRDFQWSRFPEGQLQSPNGAQRVPQESTWRSWGHVSPFPPGKMPGSTAGRRPAATAKQEQEQASPSPAVSAGKACQGPRALESRPELHAEALLAESVAEE
jgi:hypothetical protein